MRTPFKLLLPAAWWAASTATALFAQGEGPKSATVPNSMDIHTWFIILAVGAILMWGISYTLQVHKEAQARKRGRESLVRLKEQVLDEIAALEGRKEAGEVTESKYNKELKGLKVRLSRVIEQLGAR